MHDIKPILLISQDIYVLEFNAYILSRLFITLREQEGSFRAPLFPSSNMVEDVYKELRKIYFPFSTALCSQYANELLYVVTIMLGSVALSHKDIVGGKQAIQIPGFNSNVKNKFLEFIYVLILI